MVTQSNATAGSSIDFGRNAPWLNLLERIPYSPRWLITYLVILVPPTLLFDADNSTPDYAQLLGLATLILYMVLYKIVVGFCRTDANLLAVLLPDDNLEESLVVTRKQAILELAIAIVLAMAVNLYLIVGMVGPVSNIWAPDTSTMSRLSLIYFHLVIYIPAVASVLGAIQVLRFSWQLGNLADRVPIRLFHVRSLVVFSNMLVRIILLQLVIVSASIPIYVTTDMSMMNQLVAFGIILVPILYFLSLPSFRIARRVKQAKALELDRISELIEIETIDSNQGPALNPQLSQLLDYEQRVQAVWEWPFETQIKKLVLFGLLPPLLWTVSMMAEIALEGTF